MKIDPNTETIVTVKEAAKLPALQVDGQPMHMETIRRWMNTGARGEDKRRHVLDSIKLPCGRCTSVQAVQRFLAKLNSDDKPIPVNTTTSPRHEKAQRELKRMGLA